MGVPQNWISQGRGSDLQNMNEHDLFIVAGVGGVVGISLKSCVKKALK
jgi:hypothetical protein